VEVEAPDDVLDACAKLLEAIDSGADSVLYGRGSTSSTCTWQSVFVPWGRQAHNVYFSLAVYLYKYKDAEGPTFYNHSRCDDAHTCTVRFDGEKK
jgi:hypothetical protein